MNHCADCERVISELADPNGERMITSEVLDASWQMMAKVCEANDLKEVGDAYHAWLHKVYLMGLGPAPGMFSDG